MPDVLVVQSYPWSANMMEVVNLLAEEAGEPSADELLSGTAAVRHGGTSSSVVMGVDDAPMTPAFRLGMCGGPDPRKLPAVLAIDAAQPNPPHASS